MNLNTGLLVLGALYIVKRNRGGELTEKIFLDKTKDLSIEIDRPSWFTSSKSQAGQLAPYLSTECNRLQSRNKLTGADVAAILGNCCYESGFWWYTEEQISDSEANKRYSDSKSLGNTEPGDGARFKGRGVIQLTGRKNYTDFQADTGLDVVDNPGLLAEPQNAVKPVTWYCETYKAKDTGRTIVEALPTLDTIEEKARVAGSIIYAGKEQISSSLLEKGKFETRIRYAKAYL